MNKTTLVIGASTNCERYSFKAIKALTNNGHKVYALGLKNGAVNGITFETEKIQYPDVDTVSLYIGVQNQGSYYDYIESLNPKRVIFNHGTENDEFEDRLIKKGIQAVEECTLVLLATSQY